MAYIESHLDLDDHPKTKHLMALLNITRRDAVGLLHLLWHWAARYTPKGYLDRYPNVVIAGAVDWEGDPDELMEALILAGFVEREEHYLHDWHDYLGRLLSIQERNAEKQRTYRSKRKREESERAQLPLPTVTDNSDNVPVTLPLHTAQRTKADQTKTDQTDQSVTDLADVTPAANAAQAGPPSLAAIESALGFGPREADDEVAWVEAQQCMSEADPPVQDRELKPLVRACRKAFPQKLCQPGLIAQELPRLRKWIAKNGRSPPGS